MIMPNKFVKLEYSLLGCGAVILKKLSKSDTISSLWDKVRTTKEIANYEKFVLTMDYLYAIGAITNTNGIIARSKV
jgi:hypothetical protein